MSGHVTQRMPVAPRSGLGTRGYCIAWRRSPGVGRNILVAYPVSMPNYYIKNGKYCGRNWRAALPKSGRRSGGQSRAEVPGRGGAGPDQLHGPCHGSICSLCILLHECILHRYISPHATRETVIGVSDTPDHSNDIYLPSSSLIGDTDTWHGCEQPAAQGRVRIAPAKHP